MKSGYYNWRKMRTLEILSSKTWLDVPTVARFAGITPTRRAYAYLAHLVHLDLIAPGEDGNGRRYYRITERGLDRLEWLRSHAPPGPIEQEVKRILRSL